MDERSSCQEIVDNAVAATAARIVALTLSDPAGQEARVVAWASMPAGAVGRALEAARRALPSFDPSRVTVQPGANRWLEAVHLRGEAVLAPFAELAAGVIDSRLVHLATSVLGVRYTFACPLRVGERIAGALSFHAPRAPTDAQQRTCLAFAKQVALTWENARLLEDARRRALQAERLAAILAAVGAAPDLASALRALLRGAVELVGGTDGTAAYFHPATGQRHSLNLYPGGTWEEDSDRPPPPPDSYQSRILRGEGPFLIADFWQLDPAAYPLAGRMRARGSRSAVNVPIDLPGPGPRRLGALCVNSDQPGRFTQEDVTLALALASQAGAAIERARLTEVERERQRLDGALLVARTVTHQINNALAPIVGFAELMGLQPTVARDPVLGRYAKAIFDSGQEAAGFVRRLQRIVRLEEAPPELGLGPDKPVLDLERSIAPPAPPSDA